MDCKVTAISTYIKGGLAKDLILVTKMAESSSAAVAKKVKLEVDKLSLSMGQNTVVALTAKVGALEGHIQHLHNRVSELGDLMLEIVNGKIPIVDLASGSSTGTAGAVTRAEFNGYKAKQ